ncbi:hypothetical protein AAFF_G00210930 [Aldrovandia affinis]|uniref:Uncharacterized protein n=1 Tax=Aldrovandia affinis TaxID=143900 RepID=A0AAD7WUT6_9TELE|nr:hypothetical protein AAFF_G00210930 [Aldrovandia affinis]
MTAHFVYKWTDEDVKKAHTSTELPSPGVETRGSRLGIVLKDIGLEGVVTPLRAGKKWENLKTHYKNSQMANHT